VITRDVPNIPTRRIRSFRFGSPRKRAPLRAIFAAACVIFAGCGGGGSSSGSGSNPGSGNPVVASIAVTPPSPSIAVNGTEQFIATAKDASGNVITGVTFTWASTAMNIATISSGGLATGMAAGTTEIAASAEGVTSPQDLLIVTPAAGAPTSLVISNPPALSYLGVTLSPAITVTIKDQNGNIVTGATGNVTIALGTNPTSATLSGSLVAAPVNGVATFSNLALDFPAAGYTLNATYSGVPAATSAAFTVLAGHSNLLSLAGESTTPTVWWTHTNASYTATASTTGNLVLSSLESQLDANTPAVWPQQPQVTIAYSNLASTPHTIAISSLDGTGATQASTLTWVDCANLDTTTSQPMPYYDSTCANLTLPENPSNDEFAGFADPTIRKDPATGTVWLGYSWPHVWNPGTGNGTTVVDLHVASSADNGVTWQNATPLWTSVEATDPSNGLTSYTSNEVMNILPGQVNGQTGETWFSAHLSYYVDQGTSITDALVRTSVMVVNWATSPTALGSAPASQTVRFAAAGKASQIPYDVNLTTLDPSLADCQQWAEPALYMKSGNLYLAVMCKFGTSSTALDPGHNFYGVFEATPNLSAPPANWNWQYNGQLATAADGPLLEGHQFIYELDLATRADGSIVATVSPADEIANANPPGGSTQFTYGCRVLLVQGLDKGNIGLVTDANGQLEVLASITPSDLSEANGDAGIGGCTYDPNTTNGVVMVRQYNSDIRFPTLGFYVSLFNTYVFP